MDDYILAGSIPSLIADKLVSMPDTEPTLSAVTKRFLIGEKHYKDEQLNDADYDLLTNIFNDAALNFNDFKRCTPGQYELFNKAFDISNVKPEWTLSVLFQNHQAEAEAHKSNVRYNHFKALEIAIKTGAVKILSGQHVPSITLEHDSLIRRKDANSYLEELGFSLSDCEQKTKVVGDAGTGNEVTDEPESAKVYHVFSQFKGLRANQVSFVVMNNEKAKITIQGKSINVNSTELGLTAQDWKLLEGGAVSLGDLSSTLKKLNSSSNLEAEKRKIKTAVSRLRTNLIKSMGLNDNPIRFSKKNGYKFMFKAMTHELLKDCNVSKGDDAMDYLNDESFDENTNWE